MPRFEHCRGKTACLETQAGCARCGRSRHELDTTRALVAQAAALVLQQDYQNVDEFTAYLAEKIARKVQHVRSAE